VSVNYRFVIPGGDAVAGKGIQALLQIPTRKSLDSLPEILRISPGMTD